ncbi:unnamed protein product [Rotaria sp. Silwood1]|nr:unnamed protein product [Rotaria sp. Silwood1]
MTHINHNIRIPHTNGLSQDAQGHWWGMLSSTQILTEQQENLNNHNNKEQQQTKKKKRRGNQKAQHLRRRERRQVQKQSNNKNHMAESVIIVVDDNDGNVEGEQETQIQIYSLNKHLETRSENKRKRQELNRDNIDVSRSFSQLSISQENKPKRNKRTTTTNETNNQLVKVVNGQNQKENDNELLPMNSIQKFKPSYLKISDQVFKQMLSNGIDNGHEIIQCLNTDEKLQFVCQMTEKTNIIYYLDLQRQLWRDYYDHGMRENQWAPRVSKSFAKQNYTCRTYSFAKHQVEKHLQTITRQFHNRLIELQQSITQLENNVQQWQPYIDPAILCNAINTCVQSAQQRLRQQADYKRKMLTLDSNDRNLITKFYDFKPNDERFHDRLIELQQSITQLESNAQHWQPYIDPAILCNAINTCVQSAQQRLRQQVHYKRKMLTLDSNDRNLITKFYDFKPNDEQVQLAKQIWQTTANMLKTQEQEEILRKRIFLRRLPSAYDKIINQSLDYVKPMLSNKVLDKDRRASLVSNYSKTITQYKFDFMTLTLDTIQNVIRGHQQQLVKLQNKLPQCCNQMLIEAIENRRQAMEKRHELYLKHKLHSFFDEAPTAVSNE